MAKLMILFSGWVCQPESKRIVGQPGWLGVAGWLAVARGSHNLHEKRQSGKGVKWNAVKIRVRAFCCETIDQFFGLGGKLYLTHH